MANSFNRLHARDAVYWAGYLSRLRQNCWKRYTLLRKNRLYINTHFSSPFEFEPFFFFLPFPKNIQSRMCYTKFVKVCR